jgi:hypothetical protein
MMVNKNQKKIRVFILITLLALIGISLLKPIAQDPEYHLFADDRPLIFIPNCLNVLSNVPFVIIGILGITLISFNKKLYIFQNIRFYYYCFFSGIFLTGIGSAYYHLNPNNSTLVWNKLPMTISFMSFFSIIIFEYIGVRKVNRLLFSLLFIGIVFLWYIGIIPKLRIMEIYVFI